jgi:hypothetical protein
MFSGNELGWFTMNVGLNGATDAGRSLTVSVKFCFAAFASLPIVNTRG